VNELLDGSYDAVVVDVSSDDEGECRVDLALSSGAAKGEVVTVRARGLRGDPIELLGLPATLVITDGKPRVTFDR
jgi:hypothetical protein